MPNIINGTSTGSGGLITSGDDSGILNIQTNETTAMSIDASQNIDFTNTIDAPNTFGFKNRIINGAMVIDQRNLAASVTPVDGQYTLDRFKSGLTQSAKYSVQQVTDAPTGYGFSLKVTSLSAYAVGVNDTFLISQLIEGFNTVDLAFGTASAATVTLSFWVKSTLTGSFGGSLENSAQDRSYPFGYTINSASTWEYKTVTVVGDTTGTWLTTTGIGLRVRFGLGSGTNFTATANAWTGSDRVQPTGTVSVVGTNLATWQVTGVQLEKGSTATSFDFRSCGTEIQLAQRYYYKQTGDGNTTNFYAIGAEGVNAAAGMGGNFPTTMRAVPTATLGAGTRLYFPSTSTQTPVISTNRCSTTTASFALTWTGTSATVGQAGSLYNGVGNTTAFIDYSAEL